MDAKRKIDGLIKIVKKESKGVVDQTTLCCHGALGLERFLAGTDFCIKPNIGCKQHERKGKVFFKKNRDVRPVAPLGIIRKYFSNDSPNWKEDQHNL
jgi:hypothetical protein